MPVHYYATMHTHKGERDEEHLVLMPPPRPTWFKVYVKKIESGSDSQVRRVVAG